jgi:hypothetical protein
MLGTVLLLWLLNLALDDFSYISINKNTSHKHNTEKPNRQIHIKERVLLFQYHLESFQIL